MALLGAWEEVKAAEEARAALEAQLFKTKTQSTIILTEEASFLHASSYHCPHMQLQELCSWALLAT